MLREWPPRMRGGAVERGCSGDGAAAGPGPALDRSVATMKIRERSPPAVRRRASASKRAGRKPPQPVQSVPPTDPEPVPANDAIEQSDDDDYIPFHAAILPVLGSLLLTICWGYELYLSTPSLRHFISTFTMYR